MTLRWKKVYDGCWHGFKYGLNPVVILEQNFFGRRLWTVEIVGKGKQTDGVHDCFPFRDAKDIARSRLEADAKAQARRAIEEDEIEKS